MIKVWFLMVLVSFPNVPAITYKGMGGFFEKSECEDKRIFAENMIADYEIRRGSTFYIESYCMEFETFKTQFREKKELNKIGIDA